MKKHLLTAMMAVFSATAMAQYTQETALDLVPGTNTCTLEESGGMAYWKYTPGENTLITITPSSGYVQAYTINEEDGSGTQNTLQGVTKSNQQTVYYLDKGSTCYFRASGSLDVSFDATMQTDGNVGKGFSADDPVIITEGEEMYMGRSVFTSSGQTTYASYTATGDGVLVLKSTGYAYVSVNGGENTYLNYSNGSYLYNLSVESGQVYNLTFTQHYSPFILTVELTHPQPGSLDMPFALAEGENSVPDENGEYWFTYTNSKVGFGVISSESTLSRGDVKVYNSKSNIQYEVVHAQSTTGSYDVRFEMPSAGTTYYICVNKAMASSEDDTFNFSIEEYEPGDKESNPIVLDELPATTTTKAGTGTFFYAVNIPAGVNKFLNVEATSEITNSDTRVFVYLAGNSWNSTYDNKQVRLEVNGDESGKQYIIKWNAYEETPVTFTVSLEDIKQGDAIANPLPAVVGENVIDGDGTKYYTYTATLTGKLMVGGTSEMKISFPRGTGQYDGSYQATLVGTTYTLDVTEGTAYYIKIENAKDKDVFTITESEYEVGDSRDKPFVVEDGKFTFGADTYANYWMQYTVQKDGVLTVECDIPYNYTEQIMYCKSTDSYTSGMATTIQDGENYTTIYKLETIASAGDVYLINLKMQSPHEGNVITFTERDAVEGETIDNPLVLVPGRDIALPAPSRNKPVWCKATFDEGEVKIVSNYSISGMYFEGKENAEAGNGQYLYFSNYDSNYNELDYYLWTTNITSAGEYYFKFDSGTAGTILTLDGTGTCINNLDNGKASVSVSGGTLNVNVDNAEVRIYTVSGAMIAGKRVSGNASFNLEPGIYIVKINDTVKKVAVR